MRHVAVIGSGPAGFYTAEACLRTFGDDVRIDLIDQQPVPYGLIRSGVAPDHQSIKAVTRRYEGVAAEDAGTLLRPCHGRPGRLDRGTARASTTRW